MTRDCLSRKEVHLYRWTSPIVAYGCDLLGPLVYLVRADVFLRMAEFFKAYSPCIAAPYDYPDRYILRDAPSRDAYNRNIILKAPHLHWRTATSTTVTLAVRGIAAGRLPTPMDDYKRSRALGALYGIFTPIPSLASHEHGEEAAASVICTLT